MADPAASQTTYDATAGAGIAPGADDQGMDDQGMVLCTIMVGQDGTYTLIAGDEDGGAESGGSDGAQIDAPPDTGAVPGGMEPNNGAGGAASPQGQQFDSVGALLKGVLDLVKEHEASASGAGSDQDNFAAGFSGGQAGGASGSANPIGQKF